MVGYSKDLFLNSKLLQQLSPSGPSFVSIPTHIRDNKCGWGVRELCGSFGYSVAEVGNSQQPRLFNSEYEHRVYFFAIKILEIKNVCFMQKKRHLLRLIFWITIGVKLTYKFIIVMLKLKL